MAPRKKIYPWEKNYPEGIQWKETITAKPVFTLLEKSAEKYPGNLCMDFMGKEYTYKETLELVNKVAQGLQDSGITKGTRVGLMLPNCVYFTICYYAILKIGGIVVNYNPLYSISELTHQVKDSGTTYLITIDNAMLYEKASNLLQTTPVEKVIIGSLTKMLPFPKNKLFKWFKRNEIASVHYGKINVELESFFELPGNYKPVHVNPEDIAVLQYTGGTTGTPKGAILTHANIYINAKQCSSWFQDIDGGQERVMAALPFFHVFAMTAVMNFSIANGFAMLLMPKFSIEQLIRDIHNKKPTILPGVPRIFAEINKFKDLQKYDLSSLKLCVAGGAQLPLEIKQKFEEISGCKLVEGYGLTECSPVAAANPINGINKEGSIGMPFPGTIIEIREIEGKRNLAKEGKPGEICIIGPQVMQGYWNNENETKAVIKSGRLHTGDFGYIDSDGYVFIIDRIKEIIITSGLNVYPREIEELLYKHHDVEEAAVIGIPDDCKGEKIKAFIKPIPYSTPSKEEILKYLEGKLAKYKLPEEIVFIQELPRTLIGKIAKKELR